MKKSIAKHAETVEDNETINTNWTDTSPSQNDVFLFWQNTLDLAAERVADIEEMYPDTPWYEAGEEAVVS
ncbi:hypothetical protein, partial [uncultured Paraglaciecola sp.]|uniref:hypothetical protein n=1 Tax=uncultured Paraglaciecola sp. TaxID=1765024 RepID=UPI00260189A8